MTTTSSSPITSPPFGASTPVFICIPCCLYAECMNIIACIHMYIFTTRIQSVYMYGV